MTTVLRIFWPRFVALSVLLIIGIALGAGVAMAQDTTGTVPAVEDYTGIAGLANSLLTGVAAALAALVVAVVSRIWNMIPTWITANIDLKQTTDSLNWRENIRQAAYDGIVHATARLKIDPASIKSWEEKNAMLALAGQFINRFDPDIKALIDKDGNGIPDVLEIALAKIAPHTAMIAAPVEAQGFVTRPQITEPRRVVKSRAADAAVEALAAKFARQSKSAVKQ